MEQQQSNILLEQSNILLEQNTSIHSLNEFPALHYLHNHLLVNYTQLHQYCAEIMQQKKLNPIKRKPGEWVGKSADQFVNKVGDSWMLGWNNETNWLNYLIIYKGEIRSNHNLVNLLFGEIKDIVNVCGLSLLTPKAIIPPHIDEETTISKNRLTYHFNVFGKGSTIVINESAYHQTPGTSIVFDSGFTHYVVNGNDSRLLIYIDFNVEMSKKYVYGKVISVDNNQIILETYNTKYSNNIQYISHTKYGNGTIYFENNKAIVKFDKPINSGVNINGMHVLLKISEKE
ncbi:hypothetical protein QJ856_gp0288 [Tupanvirus deep ocean]|uniref:Uncharacterized protein n=2 Tax=Tupanvirus TaxID=2094720 RepID=A0AC62A9H9_9VIRU|nr:hypothetical protein QJ856_gp0288 [Tupanvirus deep ocean]QKU34446.1 hypothetical protein [Tupanvirus deep ocean]